MPNDTIQQHYSADHERLDELFHRFQSQIGMDLGQATAAFEAFRSGLERHMLWEEEILFPWFERRFGHLQDCPTHFLRQEHDHLRRYLLRVQQNLAQHDSDAELVEIAFHSLLCAHNEKEERLLYPLLDELLGDEERARLFAQMEAGRRPDS